MLITRIEARMKMNEGCNILLEQGCTGNIIFIGYDAAHSLQIYASLQ